MLATATAWLLIGCGTLEAVWGILQVYGYEASNHSLFALTGSFYNPGPYSGWLALVLPVCLHEWLARGKTLGGYAALGAMLLMLCVLPAGMSRSAWMAAAVSAGYVYGMHRREAIGTYIRLHRKRVMVLAAAGVLLGGVALGGVYLLKKDSADGRLFLWKTAARAVCGQPLTGYGWSHVPAAYGQAQEDYFAAGDYTPTEERVAGAPEYVFNEYLQVALAWGVPVLCLGLLVIGGSFYIGHKHRTYGLCGGLLSLAVFAFPSYPLQFALFIGALAVLVAVCALQGVRLGRVGFGLCALCLVGAGVYVWQYHYEQRGKQTEAHRQWERCRMLYHSGAYVSAVEGYADIHGEMRENARFLFEYGYALHKLERPAESNRVLEEALRVSSDPMVLNIIGKNHRAMGNCAEAEHWLVRSAHRLPGCIYPYYLLACLYADSACRDRPKLERMVQLVLEKEPKVQSTAIRQMRERAKELLRQ